MDWSDIRSQWKRLQGEAKTVWSKLTDDDLSFIEGERDKLEAKLEDRYGWTKDEAKRRVDEWIESL